MRLEAKNSKGVCTLYPTFKDTKETFSRALGLNFPNGKNGFGMAVELGLTPKIAKLLLDETIEETSRERERLFGSKCTSTIIVDEATAFYLVLETFFLHWLTCEGELDRALLLTAEKILSLQEG